MVSVILLSALFAINGADVHTNCCFLRFTDITDQAGLGGPSTSVGVAFCDYNRDGNLDIYFTSYPGNNRLYRNLGDGTFVDVAPAVGITDPGGNGEGLVWSDFDNDGFVDLFICNEYTPNRFFHNDGDGHFTDITEAAGLSHDWITSMCAASADIDRDGLLDLFVTTRDGYDGNILYHNEGKCRFSKWTDRSGTGGCGDSYGCSFADVNGDLYPDLYVVNADGAPNNLYLNDGTGRFTDIAREAGVTGGYGGTSCAFGDVNNDGCPDLIVGCGYSAPDFLYLNDGTGHFTDITARAGIADDDYGESVQFGDFNNDSWCDIFVANRCQRNTLWLNDGDCRFRDLTDIARVTGSGGTSMGMATGDIDNDGDLDLVLTNHSGRITLFRNDLDNRAWLKVRLEGTVSNRDAIGAKVRLYDGGHAGERTHLRACQEVIAGSGIHGQNPLECHFGACPGKAHDIEVTFPSGLVEVVRTIKPGRTVRIVEPKIRSPLLAAAAAQPTAEPTCSPNPFRTSTRIRFTMPHPGPVSVRIFDRTGRVIKELINRELTPGGHEVAWDGKDGKGMTVPYGIYFYRIDGHSLSGEGGQLVFLK